MGKPAALYDSTNHDWVPNLKMGYETNHSPDQERYRRLQLQKRRRMDTEDDVKEDENLETSVPVTLIDVWMQSMLFVRQMLMCLTSLEWKQSSNY